MLTGIPDLAGKQSSYILFVSKSPPDEPKRAKRTATFHSYPVLDLSQTGFFVFTALLPTPIESGLAGCKFVAPQTAAFRQEIFIPSMNHRHFEPIPEAVDPYANIGLNIADFLI